MVLQRKTEILQYRKVGMKQGQVFEVGDETTKFLFLNLTAFKCLHIGTGSEVTSSVFFMDNIIDFAKDISLLNLKGITKSSI
ncbi:putative UPF0481 protein [Cocos nucifera]|uniref:Putative UPF0481 protein n=1 Tax=Cocos nucifera TaxID=13894 RepID=A0A8K0IXP8_COCNU|nr:putative UPF0481 protein [Cocos nucifera]